ncbi:hypothetical protein [Hoeflea sp.]|uniref:hypothetical protein n=1 Tax=Hoeflea sp. TaxID=1940281 RepID=UPI003A927348
MKKILPAILIVVAVSSCAKRPDAIAPTAFPAETYANMECSVIDSNLAAERATLTTLSRAQNDAATGDAFSVFVIGVPLASVAGGDKEGLIAVSKGKVQALESAKIRKGC